MVWLARERTFRKKKITQNIMDAGELFDEFLLSWEAYIVNARSHESAGINAKDAKLDRRNLTTRTKAINTSRNRAAEQLHKIETLWGLEITDAIRIEGGSTNLSEYHLRMIRESGKTGKASGRADYCALRRRVNRLHIKRLVWISNKENNQI